MDRKPGSLYCHRMHLRQCSEGEKGAGTILWVTYDYRGSVTNKFWLRCGVVVCGVLLAATAQASFPSVPKETYDALKLDRSASHKEFHEALVKRYLDPAQGFGKGKFGDYWKPISMNKYFGLSSFYTPPKAVK